MEQPDTEFEGSWSWHQGQWNAPPPPALLTVLTSHHLQEENEVWLDQMSVALEELHSQECSTRRKKSQKRYLDLFLLKKICVIPWLSSG